LQSDKLAPVAARRMHAMIARAHGDLSGTEDLAVRVAELTSSRRYQIEISGTLAIARGRQGRNTLSDLEQQLEAARAIGHRPAERDMLRAMGYLLLYRSAAFNEVLDQLRATRRTNTGARAEAELLALRAIATGRSEFAGQAHRLATDASYRSSTWIATEFYLDRAGHPIEQPVAQWTQPIERVKEQWSGVADVIIDRAGDLA